MAEHDRKRDINTKVSKMAYQEKELVVSAMKREINKLIVEMGSCECGIWLSKMQRRVNHLLAEVTRYKDEQLRKDERDDKLLSDFKINVPPKAKNNEDRKVLFHDSKATNFVAKAERSREGPREPPKRVYAAGVEGKDNFNKESTNQNQS